MLRSLVGSEMCIRDSVEPVLLRGGLLGEDQEQVVGLVLLEHVDHAVRALSLIHI